MESVSAANIRRKSLDSSGAEGARNLEAETRLKRSGINSRNAIAIAERTSNGISKIAVQARFRSPAFGPNLTFRSQCDKNFRLGGTETKLDNLPLKAQRRRFRSDEY